MIALKNKKKKTKKKLTIFFTLTLVHSKPGFPKVGQIIDTQGAMNSKGTIGDP